MISRGPAVWMSMGLLCVSLTSCQTDTSVSHDQDAAPAGTMDESATQTRVTTRIGRGFSGDSNQIASETMQFGPNENVYAVIQLDAPSSGTMRVRWTQAGSSDAGAAVHEESIPLTETTTHYRFVLPAPSGGLQAGSYTMQVFMDEQPVAMETFVVGPSSP